ncbi:hypothetical protein [Nibricoccus sp. IMCC34717]|uniref:hypothetical protein n=1 Tax=Nibricoccus sp. IMCC34717 TaxID=3034021 RepID=UPI0038508AAB
MSAPKSFGICREVRKIERIEIPVSYIKIQAPIQKLRDQLQDGEEILWAEKPSVILYLIGSARPLQLVSSIAIFIAFAVFASYAYVSMKWVLWPMLIAAVVGTGFLTISARATTYAITNRRLVILHPTLSFSDLESFYAMDIDFIRTRKFRSGAGSLVFASVRERSGKRTETIEKGFFGVRDVDLVESYILKFRKIY